MNLLLDDTIAALASAPGVGGRGIVRVSGRDVRQVLEQHFRPCDVERWAKAVRAERHVGEWRLPCRERMVRFLVNSRNFGASNLLACQPNRRCIRPSIKCLIASSTSATRSSNSGKRPVFMPVPTPTSLAATIVAGSCLADTSPVSGNVEPRPSCLCCHLIRTSSCLLPLSSWLRHGD